MLTARPHILFLQATTNLGGSKRSLLESIEALSDTRFKPLVACAELGWLTDQLDRMQVPHLLLPFFSWRKLLERFRVKPSIHRLWCPALAHWRLALIHSNEFWAAPQAILLGQQLKVPAIVHLRDGHHTLEKARQYRLAQAQAILAVSSPLREQLAGDANLQAKVRVLYNGHAEFASRGVALAAQEREALGLRQSDFVIGNAGELCPRKNQQLLLEAAAQLHGRTGRSSVKIVFVGPSEPAYEKELRALAAKLDLTPHIVWLGSIPDMARFYGLIDVLVHCATREGFPRVIPEAMLAGKAVIATPAQGVRDAIPDERYGMVVKGDAASIAAAIEELSAHKERAAAMALLARDRARQLFSVSAYRRSLIALYEELAVPQQ